MVNWGGGFVALAVLEGLSPEVKREQECGSSEEAPGKEVGGGAEKGQEDQVREAGGHRESSVSAVPGKEGASGWKGSRKHQIQREQGGSEGRLRTEAGC